MAIMLEQLRAGPIPGLERVVVFLPHAMAGLELDLLREIGVNGDLHLVLAHTGIEAVDAEMQAFAERVGAEPSIGSVPPRRPRPPIAISTTDPTEPWRRAWTGLPYGFKASMLQSVEKGSRTEVDVMHGAVCRAGREAGVATPINDALWAAVRGLERRLELER